MKKTVRKCYIPITDNMTAEEKRVARKINRTIAFSMDSQEELLIPLSELCPPDITELKKALTERRKNSQLLNHDV